MLRLITSAALGSLLGGAIVALVGPPGDGGLVIGISLTVAILGVVLTGVASSMRGSVAASSEAIQHARDARRLGVARIDALRQTGTQINDQPLCDIDVTVRPLAGPAYATTIRTIVTLTDLSRFQPGTEVEVVILLDGGPEIAFVDGELSPAERAGLIVPERASVPLLPIQPHTRIVDGQRKGPLLSVSRRGRPLRFALYALVALAAAAAVLAPYRAAVEQTIGAIQDGHLRPDLRQPALLADATEALQEEIGHDRLVDVVVTARFVIVDAPLAPGDVRTDRWTYRGGRVSHDGPAASQPSVAGEQMSWSDISLDRVWPLMEESAASVGRPVGDASASVRRSTDGDIDSPTFGESVGPPVISFSIGDDYGSTPFRFAGDGTALPE